MKAWILQNKKYILIFLGGFFLASAVMGSIGWMMYDQGPKKEKIWSIDQLLALDEKEVLHRYDELLKNADERGMRWLVRWKENHDREMAGQSSAGSRDSDREKAIQASRSKLASQGKKRKDQPKSKVESGGLVPYLKAGQYKDAPSITPDNNRYLELFPAKQFFHPQEPSFGFVDDYISDIEEFLGSKECLNPAMSLVTEDRRLESRFFDAIQGRSFAGDLQLDNDRSEKVPMFLDFNSNRYQGQDHIEILEKGQGNVFEKRTIPNDVVNSVWRYNSCVGSVVLLSDQCPWNQNYQHEFKDFYYLSYSNQLVGNVYCKKASDTDWIRVGHFQSPEVPY
ncbi:MAG: hypothetical protein R3A11_00470 [Bdellovibrionota bacterium]